MDIIQFKILFFNQNHYKYFNSSHLIVFLSKMSPMLLMQKKFYEAATDATPEITKLFSDEMEKWQSGAKQIDDMLVVGIQINSHLSMEKKGLLKPCFKKTFSEKLKS
jgi:hypothetical protein